VAAPARYRRLILPRLLRSHLEDGYFHATGRAVYGAALFEDDLDRIDFLQLLRSTAALLDWRCHAYCLMGTHHHIVWRQARNGSPKACDA
jgi:putative transposase